MSPDLASRIKVAMDESGVSVSAVAERCKISVQAVYKWLNGLTESLEGIHLVELADITGHEARWIATGEGVKVRAYAKTPQQAHVLAAMEKLPPSGAKALTEISDSLVKQHGGNGNASATG